MVEKSEGARAQMQAHVERTLKGKEPGSIDTKRLAEILVHPNPQQNLVTELIQSLTKNSLQSQNQLFRVAGFFDIPTNILTKDLKNAKDIFEVRNQIVHEMDIDFTCNNRSRKQRTKAETTRLIESVFLIGRKFLEEVDVKVG